MMDDVDKRLVSILYRNGRTSLSEIGESLGMSHVAVSKRLDKLVKSKKVKVTAGINTEYLDSKIIFMGLETDTIEDAERIKKKYEQCPRLLMFAPVTGRYNVFAVMIAEDTWSLESIIGICSMRTEKGVRKSETWFGNAPLLPQYLMFDLNPEKTSNNESPCKISCQTCKRYANDKCVGCPSTTTYKGTLFSSSNQTKRKRAKSKS